MLPDLDDVLDALPLAHQPGAGDRTPGIAAARGLWLELVAKSIEPAPGVVGEADRELIAGTRVGYLACPQLEGAGLGMDAGLPKPTIASGAWR